MSDGVIKKFKIAGTTQETRDIGAEAQNITVSYDSSGKIIEDITKPGISIDSSKPLSEVLYETPPGGSTIKIHTNEVSLFNRDVTLTATNGSSDPVVVTFNNEGDVVVKGYLGTGGIVITSSNGTLPATSTLTIPYYSNYSVDMAFWTASFTITTPTLMMYNKLITVKKDGVEIGNAIFNENGVATYVSHEREGTYRFECTLGWRTFYVERVVDTENSYQLVISGFVNNVTIMTSTLEFENAAVTITHQGASEETTAPTEIVRFDNNGVASYTAYAPGEYTFSTPYVYKEGTYSITYPISVEGDSVVTINLQTASVDVHTNDFAGKTVKLYRSYDDGSETLEGSAVFLGDGVTEYSGNANFRIHGDEFGMYIFEVTE